MSEYTAFVNECRDILSEDQIIINADLKYNTSFCIGGYAYVLLLPKDINEISAILRLNMTYAHPIIILGNGSNILASDFLIHGIVIKLNSLCKAMVCEGATINITADKLLIDVARFALKNRLSGLEFACGIPGSTGGAVFMNAGAYGGEMKSVIRSVKAVSRDGEKKIYETDDMKLAYRHSVFQENGDIICEVQLQLKPDTHDSILKQMNDLKLKRASKQPLEYPSAGSVFKRPDGYFTGTLIENAGLKGMTIGGAQVSIKHAGFIVNLGGATAADVCNLIGEIQKRIFAQYNVQLYPELRIVG